MHEGTKIRWLVDHSFEGPFRGDLATIKRTNDDGSLIMVEWSDGGVSVESTDDEGTYWERVN